MGYTWRVRAYIVYSRVIYLCVCVCARARPCTPVYINVYVYEFWTGSQLTLISENFYYTDELHKTNIQLPSLSLYMYMGVYTHTPTSVDKYIYTQTRTNTTNLKFWTGRFQRPHLRLRDTNIFSASRYLIQNNIL